MRREKRRLYSWDGEFSWSFFESSFYKGSVCLEKQAWRVCASPQRENKVLLVQNATWHQSWRLSNWGKLDLFQGGAASRQAWDCLSLSWLDVAAAGIQTVCSLRSFLGCNHHWFQIRTYNVAISRLHLYAVRSLDQWWSMFDSLLGKKPQCILEERIYTKTNTLWLIFKGYFQSYCAFSVKSQLFGKHNESGSRSHVFQPFRATITITITDCQSKWWTDMSLLIG